MIMAQAINCDLCNTEAAVLLQTDLASGETMSVGPACLFPFYVGAAAGIADGMPPEVRAEYGPRVLALAELFTGPIGVTGAAGSDSAGPPARARRRAPATSPADDSGGHGASGGQSRGAGTGGQP